MKYKGAKLKCIVSDGGGWEHVSVSVDKGNRPPRWHEMAHVKDMFWEPEDTVVQYHPPKSDYVNRHPNTLHLWRSIQYSMPRPPKLFV